jgi:hypothetical protein
VAEDGGAAVPLMVGGASDPSDLLSHGRRQAGARGQPAVHGSWSSGSRSDVFVQPCPWLCGRHGHVSVGVGVVLLPVV